MVPGRGRRRWALQRWNTKGSISGGSMVWEPSRAYLGQSYIIIASKASEVSLFKTPSAQDIAKPNYFLYVHLGESKRNRKWNKSLYRQRRVPYQLWNHGDKAFQSEISAIQRTDGICPPHGRCALDERQMRSAFSGSRPTSWWT
jgi:hypothetical protein